MQLKSKRVCVCVCVWGGGFCCCYDSIIDSFNLFIPHTHTHHTHSLHLSTTTHHVCVCVSEACAGQQVPVPVAARWPVVDLTQLFYTKASLLQQASQLCLIDIIMLNANHNS